MIQRKREFDTADHAFFDKFAADVKAENPDLKVVNMLMLNRPEGYVLDFRRVGVTLASVQTDTDRAWKAYGIGSALSTALLRHGITVKEGPEPEFDTARENKRKRDAIKNEEAREA